MLLHFRDEDDEEKLRLKENEAHYPIGGSFHCFHFASDMNIYNYQVELVP